MSPKNKSLEAVRTYIILAIIASTQVALAIDLCMHVAIAKLAMFYSAGANYYNNFLNMTVWSRIYHFVCIMEKP